jgi:glycosyltransferase involved in cell wall biosynthesis
MNIACDARALVGPTTGVGTWTRQLAVGLAERGHHVLLAASKRFRLPDALRHPRIEVLPPPAVPWPGTLWLQTSLPAAVARRGVDVLIGSLAIVPRHGSVPAVAMVHDLTPRTHPHRHTLANRFCFNAYLESSLDAARAVVAGSDATARELEATFPRVARTLHRIGYGVEASFCPSRDLGATATRQRFTDGRRYVLHLGTLEPRKGVERLIGAWERLHGRIAEPPDLVLAGAPGWGMRSIEARIASSPYADRIHRPGYVDRDAARDLLRHADAFVLASEAEGYGLPLAEAICCGAPAVASDIPVLRETGGDAALYAPLHEPELADAIERALDPETAAGLRTRAAARAPQLRWDPVIDAWEELLFQVVHER